MQGVYWIINWLNLKRYIGSAKDMQARWEDHVKELREDGHGNQHIQNAWNKYVPMYGEEVFALEVVEEVESSRERAFGREQYYLDLWWDTGFLYNISQRAHAPYGEEVNRRNSEAVLEWYETHDHPMLGKHHTEESIRKNSDSNKEWHRIHEHPRGMLGKHHTEESKRKNSKGVKEWCKTHDHPMRGRSLPQEHKDKLSVALSGKNNPMYGRHHTEGTKAKQREAAKEWHKTHEHPRYWLGKHHSEESNKKRSDSLKEWRSAHENPNAKPYPAFVNVITGETILASMSLGKMCREHNLIYDNMHNLRSDSCKYTKDGWMVEGMNPEEIRLGSEKPYPAFLNERSGELLLAGINIRKMCLERSFNYANMSNLARRSTKQTRDGWRLATPKEIEEYGTS